MRFLLIKDEPELADAFAAALSKHAILTIRNAIDHGNGKGMIEVMVLSSGEVIVTDEGPGIAPEHQDPREQRYRSGSKISRMAGHVIVWQLLAPNVRSSS